MKLTLRVYLVVLAVIVILGVSGFAIRADKNSTDSNDKGITLELINVDINDALTLLAQASGKRIVSSSRVQGKITAKFKDVPFEQVLELIVKPQGYMWYKSDEVYFVIKPVIQEPTHLQIGEIEKIKLKNVDASAIAYLFGNSDKLVSKNDKFFGILLRLLPYGMAPPKAYPPNNSLIISGTPEQIQEFKKLMEKLDTPSGWFAICVESVKIKPEDLNSLGIDFSIAELKKGLIVKYAVGIFSDLLDALKATGKAEVKVAPRLFIRDNQPAELSFEVSYFNQPARVKLIIRPKVVSIGKAAWTCFFDLRIWLEIKILRGRGKITGHPLPDKICPKSPLVHLQVSDYHKVVIALAGLNKDNSQLLLFLTPYIPFFSQVPGEVNSIWCE